MRVLQDAMPRADCGRPDGLGKTIGAERACAIRHGQPVRQPRGRAIGQHPQQLLAEPGQQRDQRHGAREQSRRQLPALALPADLAPLDVPTDPLAHQHGQLSVPAGQHGVQVRAGRPACACDDQRAEGSFQLAASPRQLRMGVVARHPERGGEFVAVKFGDQAQLDDIPLTWVQPVDRGPDQFLQLGPFRRDADLAGLSRQVDGLLEGGHGVPGSQPTQALIARDRIKPNAQLARVAKAVELGRGDEERILHRVRGIGRLAQHRAAVRVERHGVLVVRLSKPGGVTSHDGRDNLWVLHAPYRSWRTAFGSVGMR
jgi:hypothetical protein